MTICLISIRIDHAHLSMLTRLICHPRHQDPSVTRVMCVPPLLSGWSVYSTDNQSGGALRRVSHGCVAPPVAATGRERCERVAWQGVYLCLQMLGTGQVCYHDHG